MCQIKRQEHYLHCQSRIKNIGFGYSRNITCSTCYEFIAKQQHLDREIEEQNGEDLAALNRERADLVTAHDLHKCKADTFYDRKSAAKSKAKRSAQYEAVCFDFAKNLPIPNKSTNDVYYRRQLSL
ncbi:voltage-dependent calcium channel unc-36 [Plakobranchus ocellatus]|uniref:Voltage-dependent calcium channel unc-36 n=1 Tax=Plakobranchus ocellatus TaxID=259542 RepID=A0AAV3YZM4_9GAST|nr:voltage-dependent calcium channel unc-36 [Plakobranchus ocellatus]